MGKNVFKKLSITQEVVSLFAIKDKKLQFKKTYFEDTVKPTSSSL